MPGHDVQTTWADQIPLEQWSVYERAIAAVRTSGLPFVLGGACALATYTGHWRNTKDLDLYVLPHDRDAIIAALSRAGLTDYYDEEAYDRGWIYRAHRGEVIVDAIWAMANYRTQVDARWLTGGPIVPIRGEALAILPAEELIWAKLYIVHRDRCDWTDVLNLIYAAGLALDWEHLIGRLEEDVPLLRAVLSMFSWLCPGRAQRLPGWLWRRLELAEPVGGVAPDIDRRRVALLDSRPWFYPLSSD